MSCNCNWFIHMTRKNVKLVRTSTRKDGIIICSVGVCGGRKTWEPGEKPSEQGRGLTTNSSHRRHRVRESNPGLVSRKFRYLFGPVKLLYVCSICIQHRRHRSFESNAIKLSVNETKCTGLWAGNRATTLSVLNSNFGLGPEKLPGLSRNRPPVHIRRSRYWENDVLPCPTNFAHSLRHM